MTPDVPRSNSSLVPRLLLAVLVLIAVAWLAQMVWSRLQPPSLVATDVETAIDPSFLAAEDLERLIDTYQERITQTSTPSDYLNLGYLYLEQARLNSDPAAYQAASEAFSQAVALSPQDPTPILGQARTALAVHEFARAQDLAQGVLEQLPTRLDALAIVADADMAVGDLAGAREAVAMLSAGIGEAPGVAVRQAELAWLEGRWGEALDLAVAAVPVDENNRRRLAWYKAYAGTTAWRVGELEEARRWANLALEHDPDSITALALSARLAVAESDLAGAAELYERATSGVPDPELVGELGDVYQELGRPDDAQLQWDLVGLIGTLAEAEGLYDRSVARFYADHNFETERAVALAEAEIADRQDPLGYDTLAWTLYRAGRLEEALTAIETAQAGGFASAEVIYHHGMILIGLGRHDEGKAHLGHALALNPGFDLIGAKEARQTLAGGY